MTWKDIIKQKPIAGPFNDREEANEYIMFETDHLKNRMANSTNRNQAEKTYEAKKMGNNWYVYEKDD